MKAMSVNESEINLIINSDFEQLQIFKKYFMRDLEEQIK